MFHILYFKDLIIFFKDLGIFFKDLGIFFQDLRKIFKIMIILFFKDFRILFRASSIFLKDLEIFFKLYFTVLSALAINVVIADNTDQKRAGGCSVYWLRPPSQWLKASGKDLMILFNLSLTMLFSFVVIFTIYPKTITFNKIFHKVSLRILNKLNQIPSHKVFSLFENHFTKYLWK